MRLVLSLLVACKGPDSDTSIDTVDTSPVRYDDDLGVSCDTAPIALSPGPPVSRSFPFLPTSNGYVAAQYAIDAYAVPVAFADGTFGNVEQHHAIVAFNDALPKNPTANTGSRDRLWDAYFGVRIDGATTWLNTVPEASIGYLDDSGMIEVVQVVGDVELTTTVFAPFQDGARSDLVLAVTARNTGSSAHDVKLFSIHNAHTGGEGHADNEAIAASGSGILETRGSDAVLHTPLDPPSHVAAAPAGDGRNPWLRATSGGDFGDDRVSGNDVAVGFQWDVGSLAANGTATRGVLLSLDSSADQARVDAFVDGRTTGAVLLDERAAWTAWRSTEAVPAGLSTDETQVFRQSTAVLRMAQVRGDGPGNGQILASLPPGNWNIAWPRDGAYATVGLIHAGHSAEAKAFLRFIVEGDAGEYASWLGLDDYLVSACRYTGDGREESDGASCPDGSDAGPNIELDDFGLFLWAFGEYARANPDDPWVDEVLPAVLTGVADPLVASIDPNRELLVADSSIWERHWNECFPNGRKHFTYSTVQAVIGLRVASELSGDASYGEAADRLRSGLLRTAAVNGPVLLRGDCPVLASAPEETCEGCGPYDGSVIDVVNQGVIRPESSLSIGTIQALQSALPMQTGSPGFLRNDDGTGSTNPYPWYDDQEWVMVDLRMATAYAAIGRATGEPIYANNAGVIVDWITAVGVANSGLVPELLSDGRYTFEDDVDRYRIGTDVGAEAQGAVPMAGFGPGAYILALEAIHAP